MNRIFPHRRGLVFDLSPVLPFLGMIYPVTLDYSERRDGALYFLIGGAITVEFIWLFLLFIFGS